LIAHGSASFANSSSGTATIEIVDRLDLDEDDVSRATRRGLLLASDARVGEQVLDVEHRAGMGVAGCPAGISSIPDGKYEQPHALTQAEVRVLHDLRTKWSDRPATTCRIIRHNPRRVPLPILAAQDTVPLLTRDEDGQRTRGLQSRVRLCACAPPRLERGDGQARRLFAYHPAMRIRVVGGAVQQSC
jgi:hypothetical protein